MEDSKINAHAKLRVHSLREVEPHHVMRARTQLTLKVEIDRFQIAEFISLLLEDYSISDLNEILAREDLNLIDLDP